MITHHGVGAVIFGIVLAGLMFWAVVSSLAATVVVRAGK